MIEYIGPRCHRPPVALSFPMPSAPDDNPRNRKAIRRAPASGEVVPSRARPPEREFDEDPSEDDIARLDSPVRTCPECRKEVFDDAEVCYHCGHAFSREPRGPSGVQIAVVAVLVLSFLIFTLAYLF